jgi:hypothetical protein
VEYVVRVAQKRGFDIEPYLWTDAVTFFRDPVKAVQLGLVRTERAGFG